MKNLILYQLEVAACIAVFYLFYRVFLRKETNFRFRRFYLLSASFLSFLLPALEIRFTIKSQEIPMDYLNLIPFQFSQSVPENTERLIISPELVFSLIWITGLLIMIIRLAISMYNVKKIVRKSTQGKDKNILLSDDQVQSFSFFKTIVLNQIHYQSHAAKYILAHEQAHTDQYHSMDVLLCEILKAVQWFNPFAWLLASEAIQNLEFLADNSVVNSTGNKQDYQLAIVDYARNSGSKIFRTEFSKSNLKNRIIMMNQPNNQKIQGWKIFMLLPIIGIMLMSFSVKIENLDMKKEVSELIPVLNQQADMVPDMIQINTAHVSSKPVTENPEQIVAKDSATSDKIYTIVEDQPVPVGGMEAYNESLQRSIVYPKSAKAKGISGRVFVQFIVASDGSMSEVKVVRGISEDCDAEAVRVIKSGPPWEAGKQGGNAVAVRMILPVEFGETPGAAIELMPMRISSEDPSVNPLIMVDGKEVSMEEMKKIDPQSITSIHVQKDSTAMSNYGDKGKNGVIMISTKE